MNSYFLIDNASVKPANRAMFYAHPAIAERVTPDTFVLAPRLSNDGSLSIVTLPDMAAEDAALLVSEAAKLGVAVTPFADNAVVLAYLAENAAAWGAGE